MKQGTVIEKTRRAIKGIQRADEATKKRWLVGLSTIAMFVIVGLWIVYLKATLPTIAKNDNPPAPSIKEEGQGTFDTFMRGIQKISGDVKQELQNAKEQITKDVNTLKEKAATSNEFSIQGGEKQFLPNNSEPVPSTTLP